MGHFDGIEKTELFEKGKYLTAGGIYDLEIKKLFVKTTRKKTTAFLAEFTVLAVKGSEAAIKEHAIGSHATWFQNIDDTDVAYPALAEFMAGVLDIDLTDPEQKEEFMSTLSNTLDEAVGEDQIFQGDKVRVETYSKLTKKNLDFTVHKWSPLAA